MSDIKPELIEKLAGALRSVQLGDYLPEPLTPTSDEALDLAHAALEAVIDDIRAEVWDEGHRTPQQREMDDCHCYAYYAGECACGRFGTGRIITPNPYRKGSLS